MPAPPKAKFTTEALVTQLRSSASGFFETWDHTSLERLAEQGEVRHYASGDVIWKKGSGNSFCFVCDGVVEIYLPEHEAPDETLGQFVTIAVERAGAVLGLSALVNKPHTANVKAVTPTWLLWWKASDVANVMLKEPTHFVAAFIYATRLVGTLNRELAEHRTRRRLTSRIFYQLRRQLNGANRGSVNLSQIQFARLVGASPEAVSRCFREFRDPPIEAVGHGASPIVVLNLERARPLIDVDY